MISLLSLVGMFKAASIFARMTKETRGKRDVPLCFNRQRHGKSPIQPVNGWFTGLELVNSALTLTKGHFCNLLVRETINQKRTTQ